MNLRFPNPWQQFVETVDGVSVDHAREHVREVCVGFDAVEFTGFDQRTDDCPAFAAAITACEQVVLAAKCHRADRALDWIGVQFDATIMQKACQAFPTRERVTDCFGKRGKDNDFELPRFYSAHGIVSTVDVVIHAKDDTTPYGVLEIDNDRRHDYDQHDIDFLTGFANVLAEAVATSARTVTLQDTVARMKVLVEDKDRLLDQMKVLAEELQHRVRNNLQLVYGMLSKQLDDTADKAGQRGIKAIARRVSTLAQVYDHLLGAEMTRTTDFGSYVKSLCLHLAEIQGAPEGSVTLTCDSEPVNLDLDVVTALGIVVAEAVTNSYDHAFPSGKGSIIVSVQSAFGDVDAVTMIVSDDGKGFMAQAESKRHGLGLVRRLVEQVRGTATVDSEHGTVWTIKIPVPHSALPVAIIPKTVGVEEAA
jgi:two-component sensor histidine kinase